MAKKRKCKITVIRKECYTDLQEKYLADPNAGPCSIFEVGQEFILEMKIACCNDGTRPVIFKYV